MKNVLNLCSICSFNYPHIASYKNLLTTGLVTGASQISPSGKHFSGHTGSALNGVYIDKSLTSYESDIRLIARSGIVEVELNSTGGWEHYNLYHCFNDPKAVIQVSGMGIGVSPLLKVVDIKRPNQQHGFGVTGCCSLKGECQDCGVSLFDHAASPPLIRYA